jgi:hypothetical protein
MVVENAFGILFSQWRVYRRAFEVNVEVAEKCVKATCVLHNFMRRTTPPNALRGNIPVGEVDPLPTPQQLSEGSHQDSGGLQVLLLC